MKVPSGHLIDASHRGFFVGFAMLVAVTATPMADARAQSSQDTRAMIDRMERLERDIRDLNLQISRGSLPATSGSQARSATSATINSGEYVREIKRLNPAVKVTAQACPLFVPLVEEGWFEKDVTRDVARQYLAALKKTQVDTLILGCTHYPLLKPILKKVMGQGVMLVDSAQEVAREVKQLLEYTRQNKVVKSRPRHEFLVSDEPKHFSKLAQKFLGRAIHDAKRAGI